ARQDLDVRAALDDQPLDDVKAVQLHAAGHQVGQVPARRGRRATGAPPGIERAPALQGAVDGARRRQRLDGPAGPVGADGGGAVEAEVALLAQVAADIHDQVLQASGGTARVARGVGAVGPIDAVEAPSPGATDPTQDGGRAHPETAGNLVEGLPPADGGDHVPPALREALRLFMRDSLGEGLLPTSYGATVSHLLARACFASTGTWPITGIILALLAGGLALLVRSAAGDAPKAPPSQRPHDAIADAQTPKDVPAERPE